MKFKTIKLPAAVRYGELLIDDKKLTAKLKESPDTGGLTLTIEKKTARSPEQNNAFHGPVIQQVQEIHQKYDGEFLSEDRVKDMLKRQFLIPRKKYYSDGSPVMVKIPHPERKGVFFDFHFEELPSTADLDIDEFTSFLQQIQSHYLHNYGETVEILSHLRQTR